MEAKRFGFAVAMGLLEEFSAVGMAKFMQENMGERVTTRAFFDAADHSFGG